MSVKFMSVQQAQVKIGDGNDVPGQSTCCNGAHGGVGVSTSVRARARGLVHVSAVACTCQVIMHVAMVAIAIGHAVPMCGPVPT